MSRTLISKNFEQSLPFQKLKEATCQNGSKTSLKGLVGSSLSFVIAKLFKESETPFLLVFNDKEEAAFFLNDLEMLVSNKDVMFYPGSYRRPYQIEETENALDAVKL